jgi:hypothetical protein
MDTKLLMHLAYENLVEKYEDAELKVRYYESKPILGYSRFERTLGSTRHNAYTDQDERVARLHKSAIEWRDRYLELLIDLEEHYKKHHDADDAEWAGAFADYMKQNRRRGK